MINKENIYVCFSDIYGRKQNVKELETNFNKIVPMSLLYDERYNVTNEDLRNEITVTIRNFYFGYNAIDYTEYSRLKVVDVSSNNYMIQSAIFIFVCFIFEISKNMILYLIRIKSTYYESILNNN